MMRADCVALEYSQRQAAPIGWSIRWQCPHGWSMWERRPARGGPRSVDLGPWPEDVSSLHCADCQWDEYLDRVRAGIDALGYAIEIEPDPRRYGAFP